MNMVLEIEAAEATGDRTSAPHGEQPDEEEGQEAAEEDEDVGLEEEEEEEEKTGGKPGPANPFAKTPEPAPVKNPFAQSPPAPKATAPAAAAAAPFEFVFNTQPDSTVETAAAKAPPVGGVRILPAPAASADGQQHPRGK